MRFSPVLGRFDDEELRDFLKDKEVLSVRDHFFLKDGIRYIAVVVTYYLLRPEAEVAVSTQRSERDRKEKWREIPTEQDWPLFNALRDWRNSPTTPSMAHGAPLRFLWDK